jgi:uncharacterized protein
MRIWAIGDLHLSFGVKDKSMDIFGPQWEKHAEKIAKSWKELIHEEDLVLIPGDLSWAMRLEEVVPDLQWVHDLPGTKVMIKGNHDYWWGSLNKLAPILPPSIHLIQNNVFNWKGISVGGARLWDTPEYSFGSFVEYRENPKAKNSEVLIQEEFNQKLFDRELQRLQISLALLDKEAKVKIAMTHYPPIGADLKPSRAAQILEQHGVTVCVFGHLHNLNTSEPLFGEARGIRYVLTSCDYIRFQPVIIL